MSKKVLAAKLSRHPQRITEWLAGSGAPSLDSAIALETITGGAVPAKMWLATAAT